MGQRLNGGQVSPNPEKVAWRRGLKLLCNEVERVRLCLEQAEGILVERTASTKA